MTVKELIENLKEFPEDLEVAVVTAYRGTQGAQLAYRGRRIADNKEMVFITATRSEE